MIGRRGPAQGAFTKLELQKLGNIDNVNIEIHEHTQCYLKKINLKWSSHQKSKTLKHCKH